MDEKTADLMLAPREGVDLWDRIARTNERIAKWDKEAGEVELGGSLALATWSGGPDYKRFCQEMAGAARDKKLELETELARGLSKAGDGGGGSVPLKPREVTP